MTSRRDAIQVLHVDDERDVGEMTATWLERVDERLVVDSVTSPSAALDRLAEAAVDCVVSDYDMTGTDGIAFLEQVRERHPDVPFILFTGKGSEEVASDAISAGVSDYLQKETGTDQYRVLANRITNLVEQSRTEERLDESQRELQETTRRLAAVFAASPVPIVTLEPDGTVELWNEAAERVFGWSKAEVVGGQLPIVDPEHRTEFDELRERVLDGREVTGVRLTRQRRNGSAIELRLSAAPIRGADGDDVTGVMAVLTPVGRRERALEELHEVTRDLLAVQNRAEIARVTVESVRDTLGYPNTLVRYVTDDGTELRPVAATDEAEELVGERPTYAVGQGPVGRAFERGETIRHDDVSTLDDDIDRGDAHATMYVPIGAFGTLSIASTEIGVFDESDVQLAEIFAANAEAALRCLDARQQ